MNKNILLLGMMLVASISFAVSAENWMQIVQGRYDCNMNYHSTMVIIASNADIGTQNQRDQLSSYVSSMQSLSWNNLYQDAGCGTYEPSVSAFRSDMEAFNGYASSFRQLFSSMLKQYIAENPQEKGTLFMNLQLARQGYLACLSNKYFCSSP